MVHAAFSRPFRPIHLEVLLRKTLVRRLRGGGLIPGLFLYTRLERPAMPKFEVISEYKPAGEIPVSPLACRGPHRILHPQAE